MAMQETPLCQTERFHVVRLQGTISPGFQVDKAVIRHPGAVVILPLIDSERICLIENVRPAVGKTLIELPAGTLEPNEPPLETAYRELTEETGYSARECKPLAEFFMSPGILDERMYVFVATGLEEGEPDLQPDESIKNRIMTIDEAKDAIREGVIEDAKTIAALLHYCTFGC